jgi:putative flavoprotein involved in K+ transport
VTALRRTGRRYQLTTSAGLLSARAVVAASGALRRPVIPAMAARLPGTLLQLHASQYRNPAVLPAGAVLVVGGGQSGAQIAEDLAHAGRQVFLATSRVGRLPRRYRGRDAHDWGQAMGLHDQPVDQPRSGEIRAANPLLTGARGGHTLALQQLADDGVVLLGRLLDVTGTTLCFSDSAADNVRHGDDTAAKFRRAVDEYIRRRQLPAPPADLDPAERPRPLAPGPSRLNITADAITTVIWCAGFGPDTAWIDLPVLDDRGAVVSHGGVTAIPGLYTLGAPWLTHRGSGILYGVATDASSIARHMAAYLGHTSPVQRQLAAAESGPQLVAS